MDAIMKLQIGRRLRQKREHAGYTREQLGELCSLSPRFIANIELGDSTFSLDSLMTVCRVLSCSSDFLLFDDQLECGAWTETIARLTQIDVKYQAAVDKALQGMVEAIIKAEQRKPL